MGGWLQQKYKKAGIMRALSWDKEGSKSPHLHFTKNKWLQFSLIVIGNNTLVRLDVWHQSRRAKLIQRGTKSSYKVDIQKHEDSFLNIYTKVCLWS